jgi:S1-C subfamily serine protease
LSGNPARLGISWRTDDAEPGSLIVSRVIPGSAAAMAGVRAGDRIYRIGGREFTDAQEFRRMAAELSDALSLEIERSGRARTVALPTAESAGSAAPASAGR